MITQLLFADVYWACPPASWCCSTYQRQSPDQKKRFTGAQFKVTWPRVTARTPPRPFLLWVSPPQECNLSVHNGSDIAITEHWSGSLYLWRPVWWHHLQEAQTHHRSIKWSAMSHYHPCQCGHKRGYFSYTSVTLKRGQFWFSLPCVSTF